MRDFSATEIEFGGEMTSGMTEIIYLDMRNREYLFAAFFPIFTAVLFGPRT